MRLIEELLILIESRIASERDVKKAISIINKFATTENPFNDILIRVMGFTSGFTKPDPDKPDIINVIPVLDALKRNGLVTMRGNGYYKRGDALGQLMRNHIISDIEKVIAGDVGRSGRLSLDQINRLSALVTGGGVDDALGDRLSTTKNIWKSGGKHSGVVRSLVKKTIIESDPTYRDLSGSAKNMLDKMNNLSNPEVAFKVLKHILRLQKSKKNYTSFLFEIENYFSNETYITALYELVDIGVINAADGNKINGSAVQDIRDAIEFMKQGAIENISVNDKLSAFLPHFNASSTASSAVAHRGINEILRKPGFVDIVLKRLTDERYNSIMTTPKDELSNAAMNIRLISDMFDISDMDEFKNKVNELVSNRTDFKGDSNIAAKNEGRFAEFSRKFTI